MKIKKIKLENFAFTLVVYFVAYLILNHALRNATRDAQNVRALTKVGTIPKHVNCNVWHFFNAH